MEERTAALVSSLEEGYKIDILVAEGFLYLHDGEVIFPQLLHPDDLQGQEADVAEQGGNQ